jgi:heptosyltransferase-2
MCTPALRALKCRFPQAQLTVAARQAGCDLLSGLPWIDGLVALPSRPGPALLWQLADRLAPASRDLCVIFPHSLRAALLAWLAHGARRVAYGRGYRRWLLTDAVAPHREEGVIAPIYMAREYLELVAPLGCVDDGAGLELYADPLARRVVRERCVGSGPLVAFAPGAAFGPSKQWMPERYAAVADALRESHGARCLLLTGPGEEATRDAVQAAARVPLLVAQGGAPSVSLLKAAIAEADLFIGNDSGPRHIAIAFAKPVVCIMGSTSPRYTDSPWERGQVLRIDVDCGPCQKPRCATDHRCMKGIAVEDVVCAARAFLPPR